MSRSPAPKTILGASLGNCVHVAGVIHFLQLAQKEGYSTTFLGPATPEDTLFTAIERLHPDMVAISYRLTPQNAETLLAEVKRRSASLSYNPIWIFGGTAPVAEVAKATGMFSFVSDGFDDINDSVRFLRGGGETAGPQAYATGIVERIQQSYPYPVLRHHYGVPSLEETIEGVTKIAEAKVLDVVSLGPDQNAQQFFFQPQNARPEFDGAGGVPLRTEEDFRRLKEASQRGNFPLMRCYSGTADVFQYAPMLRDTIDNAWAAIPLFWYNELDGRGTRTVEESIAEAQALIRWHAERGIPVEINEPHHWGLRDAHDVISVAAAYISAYNAKRLGVRHYIAQYMFNNPNGTSFSMDFARILAMVEIVEELHDESFTTYRQTRAGLPLFSADADVAKGQLAASTFMQMAIQPHIIHVVGYCEADHAATAAEVIESCKIVKGVLRHTINDGYSMHKDEHIVQRKEELLREARVLLQYIRDSFPESEDPLADPAVLAESVKRGYMDAVHIVKNEKFKGNLSTRIEDGKCLAQDPATGELVDEFTRLRGLDEKQHIDTGRRAPRVRHSSTSRL